MQYFIIGVEGATVDGRTIKRSWLEQAAKNYSPDVYGARIWIEHLRSYRPTGDFKAVGDVVSLITAPIEKGLLKGKTALLAALTPTPELVLMNQQSQKVYTSMEIDDSFADTNEAYLTGLAVTDSPASVGTTRLAFSTGKQASEHTYISEYIHTEFNFEEDTDMKGKVSEFVSGLFSKKTSLDVNDVKAAFSQMAEKMDETIENQVAQAVDAYKKEHPAAEISSTDATDFNNKIDALEANVKALTEGNTDFASQDKLDGLSVTVKDFKAEFDGLKADIEKQPQFKRTPHNGGDQDSHLATC
ncbi:MAG: phage capsid protein [Gammaproteobacteria bacterium]|nr:MAG: phage capsid protein [Gammaproteobacteria bacterium]